MSSAWEVLKIEVYCGKCNVTSSGEKGFLRCLGCGEIIDSFRVVKEKNLREVKIT